MTPHACRSNASRRGFSLVELLVVIAIIALLVGILFPVFAMVRESGRRAKCRENLMAISAGLALYKADWGHYPDGLYGVSYNGGPIIKKLAGEYVKDEESFSCPNLLPGSRGSTTLVQPVNRMAGNPLTDRAGRTLSFPALDSYDMANVPNKSGSQVESHYNPYWTGASQGLGADNRQLNRKDPPADTVVTWCLNHAAFDAADQPKGGSKALVLFLNGRVKEVEAKNMTGWPGADGKHPWQVQP